MTAVVAAGSRPHSRFVIAGDENSDPLDGDSIPGSIQQLLDHPLVNTKVTPSSAGAVEAALLQGGANVTHRSDPKFDTADFADTAPGNLRGLCSPAQEPEDRRCRRLLATPERSTVPAHRRLPLPELRPPARLDRRSQPLTRRRYRAAQPIALSGSVDRQVQQLVSLPGLGERYRLYVAG
jgi:hypothetical protein